MKVKELKTNIEKLRDSQGELEAKLIIYREKHNTGVTIAECEYRATYHACNMILQMIDDLVYNQEIDRS